MTRVKNHTQCPARTIKEEVLHQAIVDVLNQMLEGKESYLGQLERKISQVLDQTYDQKVERADDQLEMTLKTGEIVRIDK